MIATHFYAASRLARNIQLCVMRNDGRFVRIPLKMFNNNMSFDISFENSDNYHKFSICVSIMTQPYF